MTSIHSKFVSEAQVFVGQASGLPGQGRPGGLPHEQNTVSHRATDHFAELRCQKNRLGSEDAKTAAASAEFS
jgi:hypothetical protein